MEKIKGIVLAEFGERGKQIRELVKNVRSVSSLPIVVYSDKVYKDFGDDVVVRIIEPMWKGHQRYHNRNNDYWKIEAALQEFEISLILDDDVRIVNEQFVQGFDLAERFGLCLPLNPRIYFGLDREVGADVTTRVHEKIVKCPYHLTANNMGVVFLDAKNQKVKNTIRYYLWFMEKYPCRGPVAMAASYWHEGFAPYFLPEEWCVCGGYTNFKQRTGKRIVPMFLHVGHPTVKQWFENESSFEKFRSQR